MKVWVIMGNDYPYAVMDSEIKSEEWCKQEMERQKRLNSNLKPFAQRMSIYWRAYEFEVVSNLPPY